MTGGGGSAREDRRPLLVRTDRVAAGAWVVLAILVGVYWSHQVLRGEEYARLAEDNRLRSVPVTAPRGFILDRSGTVLAENEPAFTLLLYRKETKDLDRSIRFVAGLLDRSFEELLRRAERDRSSYDFVPVVLEDNLTMGEVSAIEAHALEHPELAVQTTERRVYGNGRVAAHLLGHLGEASPGIAATLVVEREAHKGIVIGKEGAKLPEISRLARADIQEMLGKRVHLEVWVRVRKGWSDDVAALRKLGYG